MLCFSSLVELCPVHLLEIVFNDAGDFKKKMVKKFKFQNRYSSSHVGFISCSLLWWSFSQLIRSEWLCLSYFNSCNSKEWRKTSTIFFILKKKFSLTFKKKKTYQICIGILIFTVEPIKSMQVFCSLRKGQSNKSYLISTLNVLDSRLSKSELNLIDIFAVRFDIIFCFTEHNGSSKL